MSIKIGINGFGRIGRMVFRSAMKQMNMISGFYKGDVKKW